MILLLFAITQAILSAVQLFLALSGLSEKAALSLAGSLLSFYLFFFFLFIFLKSKKD